MIYGLLAASIVIQVICSVLRNAYCKKGIENSVDLYLFNALCSALSVIALVVGAVSMGNVLGVPSGYTLTLGIVFGMATALCAVFNMKALEVGPLSYTNMICSCGMVLPALSGLVLYGEAVSLWQYIGIALTILSFVLAVDTRNDTAGTSFRWLLLSSGCFLFNGSVGVMQKIHQNSAYKQELSWFLIIAFIVSAVFSLLMAGYYKTLKHQEVSVCQKGRWRRFLLFGIVSGIGIAFCNQANLYLSGAMDSIIFFPVFNGGCMVLTTAAGILVWKEKLTVKQWVGLLMGAIAILLLCNIF